VAHRHEDALNSRRREASLEVGENRRLGFVRSWRPKLLQCQNRAMKAPLSFDSGGRLVRAVSQGSRYVVLHVAPGLFRFWQVWHESFYYRREFDPYICGGMTGENGPKCLDGRPARLCVPGLAVAQPVTPSRPLFRSCLRKGGECEQVGVALRELWQGGVGALAERI